MKILVVDDIEANRCVLAWILQDEGHTTLEAVNGQEAIDLYQSASPDLVLMDIMMPGIDGIEATRVIRKTSGDKQVPIIFVSASENNQLLQQCMDVGGNELLYKPVNEEELLAQVKKYGLN